MTTSADAGPEDNKPEVDKKPEPRRRKSEQKKLEAAQKLDTGEASAPNAGSDDADGLDQAAHKASESDGEAARNRDAGKALAPAGTSPIDPFLVAKAEDKVEPPPPPRSFVSRMLDYSAHAAIIVGLIGFAWTVSGHVIGHKQSDAPVATATSSAKPDETGELRLANIKLHEEIRSLKASVDSLRTAAKRDTTSEQVRVLSAGLENIKTSLGASKSETSAAIAQLQSKIDKLAPTKMQALAERVGRLEHQSIDTTSTGSIDRSEPSHGEIVRSEPSISEPLKAKPAASKPAASGLVKVAPTPPAKPAELAKLGDDHGASDDGKPPVIQGWLVRDVYQGVALIEGKRGTLEVVPGVAIPGAGVVKSIERKGGGWVVTTSKGTLAYAGAAAQREQRGQHDNRRGYGYGGSAYERGYTPYRDDY